MFLETEIYELDLPTAGSDLNHQFKSFFNLPI